MTSEKILKKLEMVNNYSCASGKYIFVIEDLKVFKNSGKRFKSEIAIEEIMQEGVAVEISNNQ